MMMLVKVHESFKRNPTAAKVPLKMSKHAPLPHTPLAAQHPPLVMAMSMTCSNQMQPHGGCVTPSDIKRT